MARFERVVINILPSNTRVNSGSARNAGDSRGIDPGASRIAFWVAFPLVLGLFSGWNQIGMIAPTLPLAWSMIYWIVLSALMWAGVGFGTWVADRAMPARTPFGVVLILGSLLGVTVTRPAHAAYQALFVPLTLDPSKIAILPALPSSFDDWGRLFAGNAMLMLFWIGGALFFAHFVGYMPFRAAKTIAPARPVPPPIGASASVSRFATRLTRLSAVSIEAIRADDHYTCAIAAEGEELILYRFADAVAELENAGWLRVHRSFCIRRDRIAKVSPRGRSLDLTMLCGAVIPVSERHRGLVEHLNT